MLVSRETTTSKITGKEPSTVFIVEWNDYEGNQQQREFDTLEDAQLEAAYLEEKYDYVAIIAEMEV